MNAGGGACQADGAYDHELHGLPVARDGPSGNVHVWQVDPDARLESGQCRAGLRRCHLLERRASTGGEDSQKDLDVALDADTSGRWLSTLRLL